MSNLKKTPKILKRKFVAKPTMRQRKAMEILISGEEPTMKKVMEKAGYTTHTSLSPQRNLTDTAGWQTLLRTIDEKPLLEKLQEIALSPTDKRANIAAISELMKLKNLYPDLKLKVSPAYDERDEVLE